MVILEKMDRALVATYLVAILLLLLLPTSEPQFTLLGIRSDKWMHAALFCGFSMLLRWCVSGKRGASLIVVSVSLALAAAMELAQGFVGRNAELGDLAAGLIGALFGTLVMSRVLASAFPDKVIGLLVTVSGLMVCVLSLSADFIGLGSSRSFGSDQLAGTALGALVVAGGIVVIFKGLPGSRWCVFSRSREYK